MKDFGDQFSQKEKKDVDDLENEGSTTRKLFIEQGTLDEVKARELQEYLDAKNKEVIEIHDNADVVLKNSRGSMSEDDILEEVIELSKADTEDGRENVAIFHSKVRHLLTFNDDDDDLSGAAICPRFQELFFLIILLPYLLA